MIAVELREQNNDQLSSLGDAWSTVMFRSQVRRVQEDLPEFGGSRRATSEPPESN